MDIIIAGPGRAGGSLALAAAGAGHHIVGVVSRSGAMADQFAQLEYEAALPGADLLVVAVGDSHISEVANRLAPHIKDIAGAVHLSGYASVRLLSPLEAQGVEVGSFHPLQTLPSATVGARSLAGSWVGVTAESGLRASLWALATTLEMKPFQLADEQKPAYHAAASAASNFVVAALGVAERLFAAAGVPFEAALPLTRQVVENAYELGGREALTGPVARGDWSTVEGQLAAARAVEMSDAYLELVRATAHLAGTELPSSVLRHSR